MLSVEFSAVCCDLVVQVVPAEDELISVHSGDVLAVASTTDYSLIGSVLDSWDRWRLICLVRGVSGSGRTSRGELIGFFHEFEHISVKGVVRCGELAIDIFNVKRGEVGYLRSKYFRLIEDGDRVFALELGEFLGFACLKATRCPLAGYSISHNRFNFYTVKSTLLKFDQYFNWALVKFNLSIKALIDNKLEEVR
jgi:hypothetical protein